MNAVLYITDCSSTINNFLHTDSIEISPGWKSGCLNAMKGRPEGGQGQLSMYKEWFLEFSSAWIDDCELVGNYKSRGISLYSSLVTDQLLLNLNSYLQVPQ